MVGSGNCFGGIDFLFFVLLGGDRLFIFHFEG